jgi:prepilin-type N-terminal cleavage/methylation domain-containing protein
VRKKAFSLLEIIFALSLIGILMTIAIPKFQNSIEKTYMSDIKTTIILVREGIDRASNKLIMKNDGAKLDILDEDNNNLFSKVLQTPITASTHNKIGGWQKISSNSYLVFIDNDMSITFTYDSTTGSFDCDWSDPYCKELSQ